MTETQDHFHAVLTKLRDATRAGDEYTFTRGELGDLLNGIEYNLEALVKLTEAILAIGHIINALEADIGALYGANQ